MGIAEKFPSKDSCNYKILSFEKETPEWLDFVCACRKGETVYQKYDIIIGNVADDDVFKTIDMYTRRIWDKERTLQELRFYNMNNQICIVNQTAMNEILTFKKFYYVE